jgi:hypothetical protein
MIVSKLRKVSCLLLMSFLPMGCSQETPPTAPSASSVTDSGKTEPPKSVKKGGRTVQPGGAGTAAQ